MENITTTKTELNGDEILNAITEGINFKIYKYENFKKYIERIENEIYRNMAYIETTTDNKFMFLKGQYNEMEGGFYWKTDKPYIFKILKNHIEWLIYKYDNGKGRNYFLN
jgi:hypothetical protein